MHCNALEKNSYLLAEIILFITQNILLRRTRMNFKRNENKNVNLKKISVQTCRESCKKLLLRLCAVNLYTSGF